MYALPTIGKVILAIAIGFILFKFFNSLRNRQLRKREEAQRIAIRQVEAKREAMKKAAQEKTIAEGIAELQAVAERQAAERAAAEQKAVERATAERAAAEQAIAEWVAAEESESRQAAERQVAEEQIEAEQTEAKRVAAEQAIAEWVAALQREMEQIDMPWSSGEKPAAKKDYRKIDAIKEQVFTMLQAIEKEREDLEYIINKIDLAVEFLPLEIHDILEKWKKGQIYRHDNLEDLKLKFRYKAYSIDDGWEVFYHYSDWIEQQRNKLKIFLRLLGTDAKKSESIPETIERAEQAEWNRYLEMDMSVIFTLKEIRDIFQLTVDMEPRLQALEKVCKKRSQQVISPPWDPRKSR